MVVTKPISGSNSVFHNLATVIPFPSLAFICYARACTSVPIAISVGICTLVNTNNVWDFSFAEEKLIKFISKCFPNLKLLPAISVSN